MLQIPHEFLAVLQGSEYAFDYAISTNSTRGSYLILKA